MKKPKIGRVKAVARAMKTPKVSTKPYDPSKHLGKYLHPKKPKKGY